MNETEFIKKIRAEAALMVELADAACHLDNLFARILEGRSVVALDEARVRLDRALKAYNQFKEQENV